MLMPRVRSKYKIPDYQDGHAYLTSHRACYVDNKEPRKFSVAVNLKDVERPEFYVCTRTWGMQAIRLIPNPGRLPEVVTQSYSPPQALQATEPCGFPQPSSRQRQRCGIQSNLNASAPRKPVAAPAARTRASSECLCDVGLSDMLLLQPCAVELRAHNRKRKYAVAAVLGLRPEASTSASYQGGHSGK